MNRPEILVIDDEEQIRKLLEITLRANNYLVIQAATAREGIIQASNHPPDLIILDLGLPDKDGLTVLEELRQWHTNPVIILSVQKEEETIIRHSTWEQTII
jgi:two-component system KDP operon response regulator KdpE